VYGVRCALESLEARAARTKELRAVRRLCRAGRDPRRFSFFATAETFPVDAREIQQIIVNKLLADRERGNRVIA